MTGNFKSKSGRRILFAFVVVAMAAAVFVLPNIRSRASKGLSQRTESHVDTVPNFDIRTDKTGREKIAVFRGIAGKDSSAIADGRRAMVRGAEMLKERVPTLKIEYNRELGIPEIIGTDVKQGKAFLTQPSGRKRADILKNFLKRDPDLVGLRGQRIDDLKVVSDYKNPDGELSFVELNQELEGVPVFQGEIKAGFTKASEIIRVVNNLAPGLDDAVFSTYFGDPADAVRVAARYIGSNVADAALVKNNNVSTDIKAVFGNSDSAPTAEKMYFPTEPGVAVAAWRVLIWQPVNAYYVIVDARDGTMLWRKNITEDQTQPATYNVYANPTAMLNLADSPFPMTPGPTSPNGVQGTPISRTPVTRIGNEAPYTFNNLGWITDGGNSTDGNNVQAGLDREFPNSGGLSPSDIDANGLATGSSNRVFDFPINPARPTNPASNIGESPLPAGQTPLDCQAAGTATAPTDFQKAAVTQLFYIANVYHDELYRLGFTEAARNFQNDNFGRGGAGGDRISAQAQDCSGVNNANFSTPADGARPQMQMYLWSNPNPDIDGSLDADVVIHELTHGVSNRLHGNSTGLSLDIARGMGEGWSDFFAHCLLSEPTDPINGIYTTGAYDTYQLGAVGFNNYYYGIRRFPKAVMAFTGGLDNRPHNPLTFADIDATQMNLSDGAFAPRFGGTADQVHNIGEVWSIALWEIRARMIQRLGWAAGNRRVLQLVIDGMKLAPLGPTPVTERDSMIAAAFASGSEADVADIWAGFALRGLGATASIQNPGGISTGGQSSVRVTEAFDLPNISQTPAITVSDATGDNDGYPEPGERVDLRIPLTNSTGTTATDVRLQVVGGDGFSPIYGTMSGISTRTISVSYTIPSATACGGILEITLNVTSSLGPVSFTRSIFVGKPVTVTSTESFDGVAAPAIPPLWTAESILGGVNFVTSTTMPDTAPNAMFALDPDTVGGGTDLTAPPVSVTSQAATLSFRNSYDTERAWDGGVLEISIAGGAYQDILDAGGSFTQNGYNGVLGGGRNNPLTSRAAWTGNSAGYLTTVVQFPAAANGRIVQLRWKFGADDNTTGIGPNPGWNIDSFALTGAGFVTSFACSLTSPTPVSISGRVLTPDGRALRNAIVSLTDAQGVSTRFTTSSFGRYQFDNAIVGQTYTLTVASKRYRFSPRVENVSESLANVDFVGLE